MARKTAKKPNRSTGSKQRQRHAAPRPDSLTGSQGNPPPGTALPATVPPSANHVPELSIAQRAEIALQQRQSQQKWTGKGMPKKGKIRTKVAMIIALRVAGDTDREIAEKVGLSERSIRQYVWLAGKNGWLQTADPHEQAENVLIHRVVSNVEEWLHARNKDTGLPDKEITIEAAKGFGIFRPQAEQQVQAGMSNVLAIQITMPTGAGVPVVRAGNIAGTPAFVEGEVVTKTDS